MSSRWCVNNDLNDCVIVATRVDEVGDPGTYGHVEERNFHGWSLFLL